jgi:hypothetical protein
MMMAFFCAENSGITCRTMAEASSSFDSFSATYGIRAGPQGKKSCLGSIPAHTA